MEQWEEKTLRHTRNPTGIRLGQWSGQPLIESLILNIPATVATWPKPKTQHLKSLMGIKGSSIARYLNNEFGLSGLRVLDEFKGPDFSNYQPENRMIPEARLCGRRISDSHPSMKFEVFERPNTRDIIERSRASQFHISRYLRMRVKGAGDETKIIENVSAQQCLDAEWWTKTLLRFFALRLASKISAYA